MANPERLDTELDKSIHRFTHASVEEMRKNKSEAGIFTDGIGEECEKVHNSWEICASTGPPIPRRKISISHVYEGFNVEIKADLVTVLIRDELHEVLNIIDTEPYMARGPWNRTIEVNR